MEHALVVAAVWVCAAIVALTAWLVGFACARIHFQRAIFAPWLRSIHPGTPEFWMRMRDYRAAYAIFMHQELVDDEPVTFDMDTETVLRRAYAEYLASPEAARR